MRIVNRRAGYPKFQDRDRAVGLVLSALRLAGLIIAEHLELGMTDADETITQLVAALDTTELAEAISRLERGFGLRVVK